MSSEQSLRSELHGLIVESPRHVPGVGTAKDIGDRAIVGAKSAVFKSLPDGAFVTGIPARPHREWLKGNAGLRRLEVLRTRLTELEKKVAELKAGEEKT